ncbi:hypothetical protein [Romboutsia ilealis]|uniref:hypothetical protein n=1 Tax=Romboutsia ilealis TaxID=1115758 RepID=UPI00272BDE1C|nr:hypothetical protein [Romboutsia ilealis]
MYRHLAESIKENNDKQFISQAELNTLKSYENTLRKKEDTYSKQELEDFIKEFDNVVETVQGSHITIEESRNAMVDNIEIYGKTVQNPTDLTDIKSVGNKLSDGRYEIPIVCTGKNMFNGIYRQGYIPRGDNTAGEFIHTTNDCRTTQFIEVKPNTVYKKSTSNRSEWYFYKADGTCIGSAQQSEIITPNETKYIALYYHNGDLSDNLPVEEFMIVEGDTLPTTYEPYIEYRTEIILPCELEKIGNISDILFVNNKDTWCIEKNIKTVTIDESYIFKRREDLDSEFTERYTIDIPDNDIIHTRNLPSNVFSTKVKCVIDPDNPWGNDNMINIFGHNVGDEVHVKRLKSDDSLFIDLESFKSFMYGSVLKYVTECPIIIPLPDNQQVKLKSFKGITHIYFDCEISGEIKCDVNKTKKSIVNSITKEFKNISNELEDIEKMEKGLSTTVKSEKCLFDIEKTNNGYISDICIEGETLVDLKSKLYDIYTSNVDVGKYEKTITDRGIRVNITEKFSNWVYIVSSRVNTMLKPYTVYTIFIGRHKNIYNISFRCGSADIASSTTVNLPKDAYNGIYTIKTNSNIDILINEYPTMSYLYSNINGEGDVGEYILEDVMILEGDHTDKPLTYFEGLKSVGDGVDNIIISSRNENILDINKHFNNKTYPNKCTTKVENDKVIFTNPSNASDGYTFTGASGSRGMIVPEREQQFLIPVEENQTYLYKRTISADVPFELSSEYICSIDANYKVLELYNCEAISGTHIHKIKTLPGTKYLTHRLGLRAIGTATYENISITKEEPEQYIPHKSDKKQLMYYDNNYEEWLKPILRSLPNGIKDTIEKHSDGKYYYHKRCGEILFDGTEDWRASALNDDTWKYLCFYANQLYEINGKPDCVLVCDKFIHYKGVGANNTGERISYQIINNGSGHAGKEFRISIDRSKLSTQDAQGFKSWLQSNNVTVVYELSQEEIYECSPIDLQTFEDTTTMIIESGPICPKTNVSVVSNIGATLHVVKEKISNLETQMSSNNTFDSIVLLQSLYSSDVASLQFNISVCNESRISNDSTIYDNDIYVLIKDILVNGKDLINLEYLETVIDLYTMVNKISYEMADELFDLLYINESSIEE